MVGISLGGVAAGLASLLVALALKLGLAAAALCYVGGGTAAILLLATLLVLRPAPDYV